MGRNGIIAAAFLVAVSVLAQQPAPTEARPQVATPSTGGDVASPATAAEEIRVAERRARAAGLREKGDRALIDGRYDAAQRFYSGYVDAAFDRDSLLDAVFRLCNCHVIRKQPDEGLALIDGVYDRLSKLATPGNLSSQSFRLTGRQQGELLYWSGRLHLLKGDVDEALVCFRSTLSTVVDVDLKADALLALGESHEVQRDWAAAEASYVKVLNLAVADSLKQRAGLGRARALVAAKRYVEAQSVVHAELASAKGRFRTRLGVLRIAIHVALEQLPEAFAFFSAALAESTDLLRDPGHYAILHQLADGLSAAGAYADALYVYDRIFPLVSTEERRKDLLLLSGEAAAAARQHLVAVGKLSKFIELYKSDPRLPRVRFRIAGLFVAMDRPKDAVAFYRNVFEDTRAEPIDRYQAAMQLGTLYRTRLAGEPDHLATSIRLFHDASKLPVDDQRKAAAVHAAAEVYYYDLDDSRNAAIFYENVAESFPDSDVAEDSRFKQGEALLKGKRAQMSAQAYDEFIRAFPDSERIGPAFLNRAIALQSARDFPAAVRAFSAYAHAFRLSPEAPDALVQAAVCAEQVDDVNRAVELLTETVTGYTDAAAYPYALYRRAYLLLSQGRFRDALADSYAFLRKFGESSDANRALAAHVYFWLGDHFANRQQFDQAEQHFEELARRYPTTPEAPRALYEAARNGYRRAEQNAMRRSDLEHVLGYVDRLFGEYPEAPPTVRAQANFLRADVVSMFGEFERAAEWYQACADLSPATELHYAALGRLGECHYSLATAGDGHDEHLQKALTHFRQIINGQGLRLELVEMARYRAAKIYEALGQQGAAQDEYDNIFYTYDVDSQRYISNWYYYSRSGYDLARLYTEAEQYTKAIHVYQRLAKAGIPTSEDARRRAEELLRNYRE